MEGSLLWAEWCDLLWYVSDDMSWSSREEWRTTLNSADLDDDDDIVVPKELM